MKQIKLNVHSITKFDYTTLTICYITKINLYTTSVDTDQCGQYVWMFDSVL